MPCRTGCPCLLRPLSLPKCRQVTSSKQPPQNSARHCEKAVAKQLVTKPVRLWRAISLNQPPQIRVRHCAEIERSEIDKVNQWLTSLWLAISLNECCPLIQSLAFDYEIACLPARQASLRSTQRATQRNDGLVKPVGSSITFISLTSNNERRLCLHHYE